MFSVQYLVLLHAAVFSG